MHYNAPALASQFMDNYQRLSEKEKEVEPTIARLHAQGLLLGDALRILRIVYHIDLHEAQKLLFKHPDWQKNVNFPNKYSSIFFL
ncbi:hypothetical protein KDA_68640 [Dictyobacter alpinus]|uniref:Uncharacterized protein n=1 Tax=Dictyobacter alpinus TaxID=2014873 RepID=A0A402BJ59_9CHLR|nr:hypothetical protein [Dictyobacter alpinus]GCE31380.1 hypothetical protein KDA_68640 [Dictyobacter alpinus]